VDSERALKAEFTQALDEVLPPAPWLGAAVRDDLRKRRTGSSSVRGSHKSQRRRTSWSGGAMRLAAAVLIVLLAGTAVVTFIKLRDNAQQSTPAGMLTVQAYQAMVSRDDGELIIARSGDCSTLQSPCPGAKSPNLAALQQWLNDLDRFAPPARFAVIDAQLRRHLAANISDTNAVFAAYQAQDQSGLERMNYATQIGAGYLDDASMAIANSHQATVGAYIASVRAGEQNLSSCTSCQSLRSSDPIVCIGDLAMSCLYEVFYAESVIGEFEASLVQVVAPDSMTAADAPLQADLASADMALLTWTAAVLNGDQAGLDVGRLLLRQAQPAVNADIASILGG
jgi:hypothetical protein